MACRSGCREGGHASWGECARAAAIQIDRHALAGHKPAEIDKDKRLTRYESARNNGLQPKSTAWKHVRAAEETGGTRPTPVLPAAA